MTKTVRQAGAIVVRRQNRRPEVLIVSARRNRKRWVLPKGSIKKRETPADAAVRELLEEAGIVGRVREPAKVVEYNTRAGRVRVEYFLLEFQSEADDNPEERRQKWCAVEDAIHKLTYASARRVLLESHDRIREIGKR